MKKAVFLLVWVVLMSACNDSDSPSSRQLRVYNDASLTDEYPYVTSGTNTVFHYYYLGPDDEAIADDQFSEDFFLELGFEDGFDISSDSPILTIYSIDHLYRQYCFCIPSDSSEMVVFDIIGQKTRRDDWVLEGEVTLKLIEGWEGSSPENPHTWEVNLDISGTYQFSNLPSK